MARFTAVIAFFAFFPLSADESNPADTSSESEQLTPLQAALIKEAVEGKQYLYPSFRDREEDLFVSNNFYALARHPKNSCQTLDLFDLTGKKKCSVNLDDNFCGASLSDVSWFAVTRSIGENNGIKQCIVYDQACNAMAQAQFTGASMIISPSGDFGTISGPDYATGAGDFRIYHFRKTSMVKTVPVQNAVFLGARFCRDNSIVALWKEKHDSVSCIKIAHYDAPSGNLLKSVIVINEQARPLACPPVELLHLEESRGHDLFGFFAIDDRYSLTAQQGAPNTTVVFDLDLRVKLFSSDRIHRTIKVVDNNFVAVGTWFDAKMFSRQNTGIPDIDEKIELFDFTHEKAIGETEGVASPLVCVVNTGEELHFIFEVSTLSLVFNRATQKFNRLWRESPGGAPVAALGKKILRYSYSTKKFSGP